MYLYRCARRGDFDKNCPIAPVVTGTNSFEYDEGIEYIHFFRFAKDAELYFRHNIAYIKGSNYHVGYIVIEVDEADFSNFLGYGIYTVGNLHLDDNSNIFRPRLEYAIPKMVYDNLSKKLFFKVKEEYADVVPGEIYYDRIPDEFRNDEEYEKYMSIVNSLNHKYKGDIDLIGEELLAMYQTGYEKDRAL